MAALPPELRPETAPNKELPPQFHRTLVDYPTKEPAGTIIVDTPNTYLYLVLGNGEALRYGVGVGREGFTWSGVQQITRMAEWPDWNPPEEMIVRQPYLPRFMAGGETNPLGARALYLGGTVYRIHGTNQPSTIGTFVSSGCIRLTNENVMISIGGSKSALAWWCCRAGHLQVPQRVWSRHSAAMPRSDGSIQTSGAPPSAMTE
jgi:lipoprotein-anchoring transpeptidase ErfK/SrfK